MFQGHLVAVHAAWQRRALGADFLVLGLLALLHVQSVGAAANRDFLPRLGSVAEGAHAVFQRVAVAVGVLGPIDRQAAGELAGWIVRASNEAAVPPQLQAQTALTACGTDAGIGAIVARGEKVRAEFLVQRVDHVGDLQLSGVFDGLGELVPEGVHDLAPVERAGGDVVEFFLKAGGEAGIDVVFEEADQEGGDQAASVLGDEAALVQADVFAVLQHRQNRGVGGGAADAEFLHLLDQTCLGIARRRLGEVLQRVDVAALQRVLGGHGRQHAVVVLGRGARFRLVGVFAVELQEPVEGDDRAVGAQGLALAVHHIDNNLIEFGRLHLGRDGPLPDQVVQAALVVGKAVDDAVGGAAGLGRADRLVRFLGVLDLADVLARRGRDVVGAVGVFHMLADGGNGFPGHLDAVGPHVGYQAGGLTVDVDAFIELLRQPHGLLRTEPEFPGCFLLQGGCGERRRRVTAYPLLFHRSDRELPGLDRDLGQQRRRLVVQIELVEPLALEMGQARGEGRAGGGEEDGLNGPVFAIPENFYLRLAVADQAQGDRLHTAGAAAARQLSPEHRRQGKPHQIVQRPSRHVGFYQWLIEFPGVLDRVLDGISSNLVESNAMDGHALQDVLILQHGADVPGYRLPLPIRIGGEVERFGTLERLGDGTDLLFPARVGLPVHGKVLVGADAAILGRQIAHVTEAGQHGVTAAEVAVDGFRLGGGLDYDNVRHGYPFRESVC